MTEHFNTHTKRPFFTLPCWAHVFSALDRLKWSLILLQRTIAGCLMHSGTVVKCRFHAHIVRNYPKLNRSCCSFSTKYDEGTAACWQTSSKLETPWWQQIRDVIHAHWCTLYKAYIILALYCMWAKHTPVAWKCGGRCPSNLWTWDSAVAPRVSLHCRMPSVWLCQLMRLHSIGVNEAKRKWRNRRMTTWAAGELVALFQSRGDKRRHKHDRNLNQYYIIHLRGPSPHIVQIREVLLLFLCYSRLQPFVWNGVLICPIKFLCGLFTRRRICAHSRFQKCSTWRNHLAARVVLDFY